MRKYFIGFLVGIVLSISATTYAADITTLIGKSVQGVFPVKVNGDVLPKTAIVIDGTSYLPVRAIGDAIGYDVSFNADLGIELKKKEVMKMSSVIPPAPAGATPAALTVTNVVYDSITVDFNIRRLKSFIGMANINIGNLPNDSNLTEWQGEVKQYQDELAVWETRKATLPPTP